MLRFLSAILFVLFTTFISAADKPVKVLFLGDNDHHKPALRFKELQPPMAERGILLTYTDKLEDLNDATLGQYDVLMIYANHTKIEPSQEKALLDFVNNGKGLVAIHCASACFGNSSAYIDLVGGRFKRHGTGVFKDTIVAPDHPAMKGIQPLETWDETYVHDRLNPDKTVLATRVDNAGAEPYTWVRTQGKGRVFYTAWGHDERAWLKAGFQDMIEKGTRWAAFGGGGSAEMTQLKKKEGLKPFEFKEAEGDIPIYKPDPKWGVQGKNARQMQAPLAPDESGQHLVVQPGFDVQLWAAEPDIVKPICMAFDERGRVWIAETQDYPNEMQQPGNGRDRIKICEDTNNDGKADKFTVFADKLSIPTSIAFSHGGIVVQQAPDTLFLKSTKGDDKADERKSLITGWGTSDTHAGPSNLRYGFDNWMWGMVGYSGFRGEVGGKSLRFSQGFYRFKTDGSTLEYVRATNNNTWGLGFSEDNIIFGSTANNCPSVYMPIANRYYESVMGFSPSRLESIATTQRFYPITDRVRQVDVFGGYTAGAGGSLYTARAFPREYWNHIQFVSEPTGHLVGMFTMTPHGADFTAVNTRSFAASDDEWAAPIVAEVGPDGALWVIDWYNFIVQHNPTPQGFKTGRHGAYETPLRDKRHGRIYRIVAKDAKPYTPMRLDNASTDTLVATLKNDNLLWRMHAQRLLVEGGKKEAVPGLIELLKDTNVDGIGLNPATIHALWTLQGLGALDGSNKDANAAVVAALKHPSAGTRRAAAMTMPRNSEMCAALLDAKLLDDKDAQVRMASLLALSEMPASEAAGAAIFAMLKKDENNKDKWIPHAAISAAAKHDAAFLKAVLTGLKVDAPAANGDAPKGTPSNLFTNASFENEQNGKPIRWNEGRHGGSGEFSMANIGHTGTRSAMLSSTSGADIAWAQRVDVSPNTEYKLSGWIKTENVKGARGALFNVHELQQEPGAASRALNGTHDWTRIETTFNSGSHRTLTLNCLFGGWGQSTGTAWYDDVEVVPTGKAMRLPPLPGELGRVVQVVTGHYARRGAADTVVATLVALKDADPGLAQPVLDGLATGWPSGTKPDFKDGDDAKLREVMKALPESARGSLLALVERWGRKDIFAAESADIAKQLGTVLNDASKSADARTDAARRIITLADTPDNVAAILGQLSPKSPPDLSKGFVTALGESKNSGTGKAIIGAWKQLGPAARSVAAVTLTRRTEWTLDLLNAIEKKELLNTDLPTEIWQQLKNNPETEVATKAKALEKSGGGTTAEKAELIKTLMPLTKETGDANLGKATFEKTCMICHTLNGKGGKVGPELTGFGAHPKNEILVAIADPNASVEANFRLWLIKTNDGIVIQGRLESESATTVELLDTTANKHVVERKDIKIMKTDNQSIMPEGLTEKMTPDELKGLLEYISQSKVKP